MRLSEDKRITSDFFLQLIGPYVQRLPVTLEGWTTENQYKVKMRGRVTVIGYHLNGYYLQAVDPDREYIRKVENGYIRYVSKRRAREILDSHEIPHEV